MLKLASAEKTATSREGYNFNPASRIWKISREYPINLSWIDELLEKEISASFLHVLTHYAQKYSAAHTFNQAIRFQHFAKEQCQSNSKLLAKVSSEGLISYRSTLNREHEWYPGSLRGFLKSWIKLGYTGINREFILNVPRRKQRGINWREQFKPFALATEIGLLVKNLIEKNTLRFLKLFNISSLSNIGELPLFPRWSVIKVAKEETQDVNNVLKKPEIHHLSPELRSWLDMIVSSLEIHSERTGKRLRVFPTRLRRTLATRAAREGFGELIIAELLDHSDTQNARVYTENVPEHVDAINKAVALQLAPLAQAFAGVIVTKESHAKRGDDLTSRVRCESGNVGTCGHYGFCGALAPIACYTCRNFQPWIDAPHEDVLNSLIAERDRILEITKDQTMASINDRTILAVTQVIQICEKRRALIHQETSHG